MLVGMRFNHEIKSEQLIKRPFDLCLDEDKACTIVIT